MLAKLTKNIDLRVIQIFLFIIPFMFGLFYEFTSFLAQILILIIIAIKMLKEKKLNININFTTIGILLISIGYLFTCIYAVDRGMGFLGFLKFTIPLSFAILIMQYSKEQIRETLNVIPIAGITMIAVSLLFRYIPFLPDEFYLPNGRMGGFFQYSNTFALFLLIGIICLIYNFKGKYRKIIYVFILLMGIFLSGSRAVLILTFLNLIYIIVKFKDLRKGLISSMILAFAIVGIYVVTTGNLNTIGRFLTTSTTSSSMLGRLLYYKDAIMMILQYPFGLGYMGYSYLQPQMQTGVYDTLYVHNDFLQLALDIGVIPMIVFIAVIVKNLLNKEKIDIFKQILLTIVLHIIIDFDLQFLCIFFILILTLNIWTGKKYEININKTIGMTSTFILISIYTYFATVTFFNYINQNEIAVKMYPIYTESNLCKVNKFLDEDELEEAYKISLKILETNHNLEIPYNVKALYYMQKQNWKLMVQNKQKALEIAKYKINNYEEYVLMLSNAIDYYARADEMDKAREYIKLVLDVENRIDNIKNSTSNIAYRLRDIPNLELSEDIKEYISKMKKNL